MLLSWKWAHNTHNFLRWVGLWHLQPGVSFSALHPPYFYLSEKILKHKKQHLFLQNTANSGLNIQKQDLPFVSLSLVYSTFYPKHLLIMDKCLLPCCQILYLIATNLFQSRTFSNIATVEKKGLKLYKQFLFGVLVLCLFETLRKSPRTSWNFNRLFFDMRTDLRTRSSANVSPWRDRCCCSSVTGYEITPESFNLVTKQRRWIQMRLKRAGSVGCRDVMREEFLGAESQLMFNWRSPWAERGRRDSTLECF